MGVHGSDCTRRFEGTLVSKVFELFQEFALVVSPFKLWYVAASIGWLFPSAPYKAPLVLVDSRF